MVQLWYDNVFSDTEGGGVGEDGLRINGNIRPVSLYYKCQELQTPSLPSCLSTDTGTDRSRYRFRLSRRDGGGVCGGVP